MMLPALRQLRLSYKITREDGRPGRLERLVTRAPCVGTPLRDRGEATIEERRCRRRKRRSEQRSMSLSRPLRHTGGADGGRVGCHSSCSRKLPSGRSKPVFLRSAPLRSRALSSCSDPKACLPTIWRGPTTLAKGRPDRKFGSSTTRPARPCGTLLRKRRTRARSKFYADAEQVLARVPCCGVPMILRTKRDGSTLRYEPKEAARLVHRLRNKLGLPAMFTPDAWWRGGHDGA
jgi:hypothetical protein